MTTNLSYNLIRSKKRKKTISLCIQREGVIAIHVPYNTPQAEIDTFLKDKKLWIDKKLSEQEGKSHKPKVFMSGEVFLYLGKSYQLKIQDADYMKQPLALSGRRFILHRNYKDHAKELFFRWYRKKAYKKIIKRVEFYSQKFQLFPKAVKISNAEYRWGSCSSKNILSFTWRLIMTPYPVIDYIIVHELLHMMEKNHSQKFWSLLETIMPDFQKHKQWLKNNGYCLSL